MASTHTGPLAPRHDDDTVPAPTPSGPPPGSPAPESSPPRPAAVPTPSPFAPTRIGRYEILAEVASGGMGRVYMGRVHGALGFEKLVAIKTIHGELASEQAFVDMFFDEARIASRIDHECVCRVFDFGEADGQYYLAMEYLLGINLGRILRALARRPHEPELDVIAAHIVAQAAEGLHAAHELADEHGRPLDIVHRDVSPQNVFVTFDGGIRVVDFGIASAEGRRHRTATGSLKGKLAYMAPEQLRREKADRRADVWALGVVLWELLTAERLYRGETEVETLLAILNDPVRHPRSVRPSIDPALDAIVMNALERDRERRCPSARALARSLREYIVSRQKVIGASDVEAFVARLMPEERRAAFARVDEARRTPARASALPPLATGSSSAPSQGAPSTPGEATRPLAAPSAPAGSGREAVVRPATLAVLATTVVLATLLVAWGLVGPSTPVAPTSGAATSSSTAATSPPTPTAPAVTSVAPPAPGSTEAPTTLASGPPTDEPSEADDAPEHALVPPAEEHAPPRARRARTGHVDTARSAPRTPTADPGEASGIVSVTTPGGWADVYADGRLIGRTPLTTQLPIGTVELELRPFTLAMPDDARTHRRVLVGPRITQISVPLGTDGRPR